MTAGTARPPTGGRAPRLAAVVVNFGSHALIEANVAPADDPLAAAVDVVVVDNFHSASERVAMAEVCSARGWRLVPMADNAGFGAACNAGIAAAAESGASGVLLVNPDAVVSGAVALSLAEQLAAEPLTLIAPRVVSSAGDPYFHGIQLDLTSGRMRGRPRPDGDAPDRFYPRSDPGCRDWLSGACLAFGLELWRRAGGWDEGYFLYWEDVDFSQRCVEAGARLCIRNDLLVVHDEGATHGEQRSRARSNLYYYYNCRNRLRYAARHLARQDRLSWLLQTPRESWQILMRGGKRQLLDSPRPLWSAVRGASAGAVDLVASLHLTGSAADRQGRHGGEPLSDGR